MQYLFYKFLKYFRKLFPNSLRSDWKIPLLPKKNSPVFYTREFHTASKGPAALLFPYFSLSFSVFFLCLSLHQNMVTAQSFSILCSITNRTLFNKQYDFFSTIINIDLISISYSVEQSNIFLQENAFHLIAV